MSAEQSKAEQTKARILQGAVQEFAIHGYSRASTNHIMEQVGMAKGLLFHYFPSKQQLYLACLQKVLRDVQQELDAFLRQMSDDLFQRLADFLQWKHRLALERPQAVRFLAGIPKLPAAARPQIDEALLIWRRKNSRLLADYDQELWDPQVNQKDALAVVVLVFESFDLRWVQQMDADPDGDPAELLEHALQLLDVLRVGFYRSCG